MQSFESGLGSKLRSRMALSVPLISRRREDVAIAFDLPIINNSEYFLDPMKL